MEEVWGLPAHPLLVHFPVVLLPAFAAGACAMAVRPTWRRRFSWHLLLTTLVAMISAILATQSGEPFEEALQPALGKLADKHEQLGERTALFATLFFAGAAITAGADRWLARRRQPDPLAHERSSAETLAGVLSVLTAIVGVLAAVWVLRTGHEGARITWSGIDVGGR